MGTYTYLNPIYWLVITFSVILQIVRGEISNSTENSNYTKTLLDAKPTISKAKTKLNHDKEGEGDKNSLLLSTITVQNSTYGDYGVLTKDYSGFPVTLGIIIGASIGVVIILLITSACVFWCSNRKSPREKSGTEFTDNEHLRRIENSFSLQMENQVVLLQTSDLMKFPNHHKEVNRKIRNESEDEGVHSVDEEELCYLPQHTLLKAVSKISL
ncbi:DgyrCDS14077 [Dimorphilus gyrociliatus]|uniref:DgyrCDS14077 n=1 Tax=Dimorphilus gyrociliatus TaxID=2664684 RepID=A0A7I8WCI1_9ANNE|nr:DgyrCDS14077 [Dimorphilus gyrociliatus]